MSSDFNTGMVLFSHGAFGGAPKRYTNLFLHLNKLYPGRFFYFINKRLSNQIKEVYTEFPLENVRIIDFKKNMKESQADILQRSALHRFIKANSPEGESYITLIRKLYRFYKNYFQQHSLYKQIEKFRNELNIKVFYGIFSGVFPLVFYLKQEPRKAAVVFSDMDSWFSNIQPDSKKLWHTKYYSFNYALENCDHVDFLSPYILEGVKRLMVKIKEDAVSIAPCSFADYSYCKTEKKGDFGIVFSARLEPDKNPMLYLGAAKEIIRKYPFAKFYLLGDGKLKEQVREFIDYNNLSDKIEFGFHINPPAVLQNSKVFVSVQTNTNYPSQSVLEAMACGNAVIASDVGDTRLLVNEHNGILIPLEERSLVLALEKLINNPELTKSLGKNGHDFVLKNHTLEKYSFYYIDTINRTYKRVFNST